MPARARVKLQKQIYPANNRETAMLELIIYVIIVILWPVILFWQGDKKLNMRTIASVVALGAFLLAVAYVLSIDWSLTGDTQKLLGAFVVVAGFAGLIMSWHVYFDGIEIDRLKEKTAS